jgi:very-short-patch-repair endonuclease
VRGLARLLRRNPTDAERILWQALTTDRRFAGQFKRQTPVGRHIPDFVSFVKRVAVELVNAEESEVIAQDRAARKAWLEARGYRVCVLMRRMWSGMWRGNRRGLRAHRRRIGHRRVIECSVRRFQTVVMAGPVPAIHVLSETARRGCPAQGRA